MTHADIEYRNLLKDIMENGTTKDTRAGYTQSVFGRQIRFNLRKGFPLLTTKKIYFKGVLHELLWFLQHSFNSHSSMNIEYLVRNNVHIWDDDAYRWYRTVIVPDIMKKLENPHNQISYRVVMNEDDTIEGAIPQFTIWDDPRDGNVNWLKELTKEEFLELTLKRVELKVSFEMTYRFGDLGPVYGKQWRCFGNNYVDQINELIMKLKTNPDDRRMLCIAFNPDQIGEMALPPCHVMFQFYTRLIPWQETKERLAMKKGVPLEEVEKLSINEFARECHVYGLPTRRLSCMYTMRSNDVFLGQPFNTASYALLTHMIAKLVNMEPDELVASIGDCHIYEAHKEAIWEQLSRNGSDVEPQLVIHGEQKSIEDFRFEDFEVVDYNPDPPIKAPLLVG